MNLPTSPSGTDREFSERLRLCVEACTASAMEVAVALEDEGRMLREGDLDRLESLLQDKSERLAALEAAEARWREVYSETGLPEGRPGVRVLLRTAEPELRRAWERLEEQLSAVQRLNEANGRLIQRNLSYRRRLLEILAHGGEEDSSLTYGTDGNRAHQPLRREITRA